VFDVLGKLQFEGRTLRDRLIEAIRQGETEEVKARLTTVVEHALGKQHLQELLEDHVLAPDIMDASRVQRIRHDTERANARRPQPHDIESFFLQAFASQRGSVRQREPRRFKIAHVPVRIRHQDASFKRGGDRRVISKRMHYGEIDASGSARHLHDAPYLDFRPLERWFASGTLLAPALPARTGLRCRERQLQFRGAVDSRRASLGVRDRSAGDPTWMNTH
jgi:hypothetical protein